MKSPLCATYFRARTGVSVSPSTESYGSTTTARFTTSNDALSFATPFATSSPTIMNDAPLLAQKRHISFQLKIGLCMIPAVVAICAIWLFLFIWWRKTRLGQNNRQIIAPIVVKEDRVPVREAGTEGRTQSKICQMRAWYSPPPKDRREARIFSEGRLRIDTDMSLYDQERHDSTTFSPLAHKRNAEIEMDSPIDGRSPFRLKRGDTQRHPSQGSEESIVWPSLPPAVWVNKDGNAAQNLPPPHAAHGFSFVDEEAYRITSMVDKFPSPPVSPKTSFSQPRPPAISSS